MKHTVRVQTPEQLEELLHRVYNIRVRQAHDIVYKNWHGAWKTWTINEKGKITNGRKEDDVL